MKNIIFTITTLVLVLLTQNVQAASAKTGKYLSGAQTTKLL
jgi:hypothetical protein